MSLEAASRKVGDVTVLDLSGRITLGDGTILLRGLIRKALDAGERKVLLNLAELKYLDSSGLGELVTGCKLVKAKGGEFKLLNLNKKVAELLRVTKLYPLFDIYDDERRALASFKP